MSSVQWFAGLTGLSTENKTSLATAARRILNQGHWDATPSVPLTEEEINKLSALINSFSS
jgi:HAMP domain-containing protein